MASEIIELEAVEPDSAADQRYHLTLLVPSVVVIVLSALLTVPNDSQVVLPLLNVALPDVCSFKRTVGVDCPGCGLTRCFVSMGHGRVTQAFQFNPVGIFFFLMVAAQIPYRLLQILRVRRGLPEWRLGWFGYGVLIAVAVALLVQWVVKMVGVQW